MNENNPYKARETFTFSISKDDFSTVCKISEKNSLIAYLKFTLLLTIIACLLFLLPSYYFALAMLAFVLLFSLIYFLVFFRLRSIHKKQLRNIEKNLYNYTLYSNHVIVTLKNNKHIFKEYTIRRRKIKAKQTDGFLYFYYKRRTFAMPMRALDNDSKFLSLEK